jgi:hypothetical protein
MWGADDAQFSGVDVKNHEARIKRLYALAEKVGRLGGETHNLVTDLSAKIAARRAATRSTSPGKPATPPSRKKS